MMKQTRSKWRSGAAVCVAAALAAGAGTAAVLALSRQPQPSNAAVPAAVRGNAVELMGPKTHGTCPRPVQDKLRWDCDRATADRISCFNRHYAEYAGYWETTTFQRGTAAASSSGEPTTFYDSVTGRPLFVAPVGRSWEAFLAESDEHGWPSFRDAEVIASGVRVLEDGEVVSVDGTHLGHNLPDGKGNRYCINLVSVAGFEDPTLASSEVSPAGESIGMTTVDSGD